MTREEAIKELRGFIGQLTEGCQEAIKVLIPELAEGEDERIRKVLINIVKGAGGKYGIKYRGDEVTEEMLLTYLEKQKTSEESIRYVKENHSPDEVSDFQAAMNIAVSKAYDKGVQDTLEKQKDSPMPEDTVIFQKGVAEGRRLEREGLPYWQIFKGIGTIVPDDYILVKFGKGYKLIGPGDTIEIGTKFLQVSQLDNLPKEEKQKEQKPAEWSEEDKTMINHIIEALPKWANGLITILPSQAEEYVKRLKSLRPQQKQWWSEEDEVYLQDALWCVKQASKVARGENDMGACWSAERWLKSLRPQFHWKPSEEQMNWLESAVRLSNDKPNIHGIITSLHEQLKKL